MAEIAAQDAPRFITTADGTRLRCATFEAEPGIPPRGVCLVLHGQTEFIEKYDEVIGELRRRGFSVVTFDWRGQGGSARLLTDPLPAHIREFAQYDDDLASVLAQIVRPLSDAPPFALAHSMGAHILLRALHARPEAFRGAVLSAPMLAFSTRGYPALLTRAVTRLYTAFGRSADFAWGMAARDPLLIDFDSQLVTSDRARFAHAQSLLRAHPELRLAGPSWGWIEAAYRSMRRMLAPGYGEAITTPLLVCGAGHDRICITAVTRAFARRLPRAEYVEFARSEHEILMENDAIRAQFWAAFDRFVSPTV